MVMQRIKKLALNMTELAAVMGIGRSKTHELIWQPGFPVVFLGRCIVPDKRIESLVGRAGKEQ